MHTGRGLQNLGGGGGDNGRGGNTMEEEKHNGKGEHIRAFSALGRGKKQKTVM